MGLTLTLIEKDNQRTIFKPYVRPENLNSQYKHFILCPLFCFQEVPSRSIAVSDIILIPLPNGKSKISRGSFALETSAVQGQEGASGQLAMVSLIS